MARASIAFALALLCACGGHESSMSDAAPADAGVDAGPFACGLTTCEDSTQYCYVILAGASRTGATVDVGCNALPASCPAAPTCDCVLAEIQQSDCAGGLTCNQDGARITVACNLP